MQGPRLIEQRYLVAHNGRAQWIVVDRETGKTVAGPFAERSAALQAAHSLPSWPAGIPGLTVG